MVTTLSKPETHTMKTTRKPVNQPYDGLVSDLRRKDRRAIAYLYDNYSKALFGVVQRIVNERELAEEVFHDAFVKIYTNIHSYDERKARLFTWMLNICRNAAIDKLKSKAVKKQARTDGMDENMEGILNRFSFELNTDGIGMYELLEKLHPDYRFVIQKLYFQGYSQQEISKECDIPLGTVKTRTRAALRDLRRLIG